jgi:DnaJ-class molecular chaperone
VLIFGFILVALACFVVGWIGRGLHRRITIASNVRCSTCDGVGCFETTDAATAALDRVHDAHHRLMAARHTLCAFCNGHGFFIDPIEAARVMDAVHAESQAFKP